MHTEPHIHSSACGCPAPFLGTAHNLPRAAAGLGGAAGEAKAASQEKTARALVESGVRSIDIHAHFQPQEWLDLLVEEGPRFGSGFQRKGEDQYVQGGGQKLGPTPVNITFLDRRLKDMNERGIKIHVLSLSAPMTYWADEDLSHRLSKVYNDAASAAHIANPDRFYGFITLPMLAADRAIDELDRASKLPGLKGVYIGTNVMGTDLDDPRFFPIYERIEKLGLPIFLHPLHVQSSKRTQVFHLNNLIGNPTDTAIAAAHLIFGGVLDRFPKLEFNLPHAGGILPVVIGRWDHGWSVRPETRHSEKPPSSYLNRFTFDTICYKPSILKFLVSEFGADRIMLGSDYCADMNYERPLDIIEQAGLSSADKAKILGGNAARILKL